MSKLSTLSNMKIEFFVKDALERAGLQTPQEILLCSESELQQRSNLSLSQCLEVRKQAGRSICKTSFISATELAVVSRLTTGCSALDVALNGGVPTEGITEIYGASGCGKTQLCLQLSLTSQWPLECRGLAAGVLYICTEDVFPSKRLQQLISSFPSHCSTKMKIETSIKYGDNIYIEHVVDAESLEQCLQVRAPQLLARHNVRLLVLDSVAGVFRAHLENGAANRALSLRGVATQLTKLAVNHQAAVICVNQVAKVPCTDSEREEGDSCEVPALGLSWANLVHTKLRLGRGPGGGRFMEVFSSPELPSGVRWPYHIYSKGIFGDTP